MASSKQTSKPKQNQKLVQDISKKLPDKTLFDRVLQDKHADVTNECLTQMGYVVDYLYDNQIPFHVEQTTSGGYLQLLAVTDSPKAKITLTGKGSHIDYIGSGIKASQRYAFTTTTYNKNGGSIYGNSNSNQVNNSFRPSKKDIEDLLNVYLKNDMSSFRTPSESHTLSFDNNQTRTIPNVYYRNGRLKKSYRTIQGSNGQKQDIELLVQSISTGNIDGELSPFATALTSFNEAINDSRDYLVSEIMQAAPFIFDTPDVHNKKPSDFNIDDNEISDMIYEIRDICRDVDSEYGIELTESSNKYDALTKIATDYVNSKVLELSKDDAGNYVQIPNDVEHSEDIPTNFTFNYINLSDWMAKSQTESNVIVQQRLQSIARSLDLRKENIKGDDNRNALISDSLISFDETTSHSKDDFAPDSFNYRILNHTENYLADLGINAKCRIDDNGLIDINGYANGINNNESVSVPVHAQIGQIFAPDEHNVVHVKRNSNENFLFVPGYRAFIEEDTGANKNMMERTVLTGYFSSACSSIDNSLSSVVKSVSLSLNSRRNSAAPRNVEIALPTACNSVYGETYGTRLAENHMENALRGGFDRDDVYAIYEALSGKIAYSREMDSDATTINSIGGDGQKTRALEIAGQNIREMGSECLGYVYTNMTNTGRGSGTRRYLCSTARVAEDGHIIQGDVNDLTSPLFSRPMFSGVNHNALDRNVMAFSQILTAQGIDKNARGCHMTIDGWTLDDGYVVSKKFAEKNMVTSAENGELRPLQIGDKISDMNGNKGVINIVIDPDMSEEEAKKQGILPLVQLMKLNPDVDFIGAPYSGMSRSNAGTALSMTSNSSELKLPNGETVKGCIGTLPILITGMTVDTKTHVYDDDSDHQRNSSGQLSWMLSSKKLDAISKEIYGNNENGLNELRAYLNIIGITLDKDGNLHKGFGANVNTLNKAQLVTDMSQDDGSGLMKVKKFDEFVLDENAKQESKRYTLHRKASAKKWNDDARDFNGFLQLPFAVQGADGNNLEVTVNENGKDKIINVMPVVSASYRSDIQNDGNETYSHDYTRNYATIVENAGKYMSAATRLGKLIAKSAAQQNLIPNGITEDKLATTLTNAYASREVDVTRQKDGKITHNILPSDLLEEINFNGTNMTLHRYSNVILNMADKETQTKYMNLRAEQKAARVAGQSEYNNIVNDTITKKFEDRKHGAIASALVKVGCKNSATAVWTADPRLEIDEVAMPKSMYDQLNVKDDHILIWRDPLLRDAGIRYMKVVINNDLTGIAVNPMIDKEFDGDFDGDSLGMLALQTKEAQAEAMAKLTIQANVLDYGVGADGHHPIVLQDGMDVTAALNGDSKLKAKWKDLEATANQEVMTNGVVSNKTFDNIKSMTHDILKASSYQNVMDYDSPKSVAESLVKMSKEFGNGAKGNINKMKHFMEYMDYSVDVDDKGNVAVKSAPMSNQTRFEHNKNVCIALGCKCDETGVAGYASQKAIRALRDICPTEALELTYPVTQGMLQAKHDAAEAQLKANLTQNVIPDLWEGRLLTQDDNGNWSLVHSANDKNKMVSMQATPTQWKNQFMRIMCQANGIDIAPDATAQETRDKFSSIMNPDALDKVANALTDKKTNSIIGVTQKAAEHSSVIDNIMYGVAVSQDRSKKTITDYIVEQANKGTNLFANGGEIFEPESIRERTAVNNSSYKLDTSMESSYVKEKEQSDAIAFN